MTKLPAASLALMAASTGVSLAAESSSKATRRVCTPPSNQMTFAAATLATSLGR
jgi:hypothetical protein